MERLAAADSVEIQVLVDNASDGLSSNQPFVENEMAFHWRNGMKVLGGNCLCCAAHGLSCLVKVRKGRRVRTMLFDTGPDPLVFSRNARLLKVDFAAIDALMLSHGHWDHGGGILKALDLIAAVGGKPEMPVHMHPGMFARRAVRAADGTMRQMRDVPKPAEIAKRGGRAILKRDGYSALDGFFWISGEIPRVTPFERGMPGQHRRTKNGGWELDEALMDERALYVDVAGLGLIVLSACSHAGIVNVLQHARMRFPDRPVHCAMGGFHLAGANEAIVPQTVAALRALAPRYVAAGHCTGWRAMAALAASFGEQAMAPLAVGKRFTFAA
jgi:7,8-dihydropterin-6-yl-methyl-4-(beta-D-ribofuranosyl)aminobenzene 5'-phosphate synthase